MNPDCELYIPKKKRNILYLQESIVQMERQVIPYKPHHKNENQMQSYGAYALSAVGTQVMVKSVPKVNILATLLLTQKDKDKVEQNKSRASGPDP